MIFESIWIKENDADDDNTKCDICLGISDEDNDRLVFCDGCNICTH